MVCELKNCNNEKKSRGYCAVHYHQKIFIPAHPLWYTYQNMIRRCHYEKHPRFADWGGRGVKVCERWRNSYENFEQDMGLRPTPFHQIDRIDNDGNYEPNNCHWVLPESNSGAGKRRLRSSNTSGKVGVCYSIRAKKWQASITINKKRHHLGWFENKDEAISARELGELYYANVN